MKLSAKTSIFNFIRLLFRNRFVEALLVPLTKGKKAESIAARIPANYYQYPQPAFRTVQRHGFQYKLDISQYMQWLIYFGIQVEPRNVLYNLAGKNKVVYDVGANIGETTMMFSRLSKSVVSFEPDPDTYQHLLQHLNSNACDNVTAINAGLGKQNARLSFERNATNSGGNRISIGETSGIRVEVRKLDELIAEKNLPLPDLIKIDTEGYEEQVLIGALETIRQCRPVIFAEMNNRLLKEHNSSIQSITELLKGIGYRIQRADTGRELTATDINGDEHFDIIAKAQ